MCRRQKCPFSFTGRRRHTRSVCDWSSGVCSSDLGGDDGVRADGGGPIITPAGAAIGDEGDGGVWSQCGSITARPGGSASAIHVEANAEDRAGRGDRKSVV